MYSQNIEFEPSFSQKYPEKTQEIEENCIILTPKAPNLRPMEPPDIEIDDFLLPEPLMGEDEFILGEEQEDEELEDFFLDEEPPKEVCEGNLKSNQENSHKGDHSCKRGQVDRFYNRNANLRNRLPGNENSETFLLNSDYQMSQINDNFKSSAEGVVELILRKKSISV